MSDAIDLLIQSGRTIDAIRMEGWRVDVGYPEDRREAERRLGSVREARPPERDAPGDEAAGERSAPGPSGDSREH
jgi:glucose-1-phosphate thymidylyltransferase